jgi:hypothetical protein
VDGAIGRREEKARQGNRDGTHRDVRGARRAEVEDKAHHRAEEKNLVWKRNNLFVAQIKLPFFCAVLVKVSTSEGSAVLRSWPSCSQVPVWLGLAVFADGVLQNDEASLRRACARRFALWVPYWNGESGTLGAIQRWCLLVDQRSNRHRRLTKAQRKTRFSILGKRYRPAEPTCEPTAVTHAPCMALGKGFAMANSVITRIHSLITASATQIGEAGLGGWVSVTFDTLMLIAVHKCHLLPIIVGLTSMRV